MSIAQAVEVNLARLFPVFGSYAVPEGHEERPERGQYFLACRLTAPLWRYILYCYDALTLRFLFLQSSEVPLERENKVLRGSTA